MPVNDCDARVYLPLRVPPILALSSAVPLKPTSVGRKLQRRNQRQRRAHEAIEVRIGESGLADIKPHLQRTRPAGEIEGVASRRQRDLVQLAIRRACAVERCLGIDLHRLRGAGKRKIDPRYQRAGFAVFKRPAEIDRPGGADQIGIEAVVAGRVERTGGGKHEGAGGQIAGLDVDLALVVEGGGDVDRRLAGKELPEGRRQQRLHIAAALDRDVVLTVRGQLMVPFDGHAGLAVKGRLKLALPIGKRSFAGDVQIERRLVRQLQHRSQHSALGFSELRLETQPVFRRRKRDVGGQLRIADVLAIGVEDQVDAAAVGAKAAAGGKRKLTPSQRRSKANVGQLDRADLDGERQRKAGRRGLRVPRAVPRPLAPPGRVRRRANRPQPCPHGSGRPEAPSATSRRQDHAIRGIRPCCRKA